MGWQSFDETEDRYVTRAWKLTDNANQTRVASDKRVRVQEPDVGREHKTRRSPLPCQPLRPRGENQGAQTNCGLNDGSGNIDAVEAKHMPVVLHVDLCAECVPCRLLRHICGVVGTGRAPLIIARAHLTK